MKKTYAQNDVVQHRTLLRPESAFGTAAMRADGTGTRALGLDGGGHRTDRTAFEV
jgi:hypothetical protein